ncbi:unnamed protein product [Coregonus sp. 'balchen']|nr:unnamed protein product [Coregonus sp. 'balchen']
MLGYGSCTTVVGVCAVCSCVSERRGVNGLVVTMDPAWRQQGRGRGRGQPQGQGSRPQRERAAESPNTPSGRGRGGDGKDPQLQPVNRGKNMAAPPQNTASSQSKFEEIRKSNQAAAQRLAQSQYSSSSDDDDDDDDGGKVQGKDGKRGKILASTLTTYTDQTGEMTRIC